MQRGVLNCLEKVKQPKRGLNGMSFGPPIRMWRGFLLLFGKVETPCLSFFFIVKIESPVDVLSFS